LEEDIIRNHQNKGTRSYFPLPDETFSKLQYRYEYVIKMLKTLSQQWFDHIINGEIFFLRMVEDLREITLYDLGIQINTF
jgi:hypothetical protein